MFALLRKLFPRHMSLDEFFVELERSIQQNGLQWSWKLEEDTTKIRLVRSSVHFGPDFTPLTLVAYCTSKKEHLLFTPDEQEKAGRYLGLCLDDARNIGLVSDYDPEKDRLGSFLHAIERLQPERGEKMLAHLRELRRRLLRVTHIYEESHQVS